MPMVVLRAAVFMHGEPGRRDAGAQNRHGTDVKPRDGEAAQRAFEVPERQTGIEHRAKRHVAGNPREAVEIKDARHECWGSSTPGSRPWALTKAWAQSRSGSSV